jgi:hypothetical protein
MDRRTVLRTVAGAGVTLLAGCGGSTIDGAVVTNTTPLTVSHDYTLRSTPYGTEVVVDVTARHDGEDSIDPDEDFPATTCTFQNGAGETLHESARLLKDDLEPGDTVELAFELGTNVDQAKRYELSVEWQSERQPVGEA